MINSNKYSFRDVKNYPSHLLETNGGNVQFPATYKKVWDDGFGARGCGEPNAVLLG